MHRILVTRVAEKNYYYCHKQIKNIFIINLFYYLKYTSIF